MGTNRIRETIQTGIMIIIIYGCLIGGAITLNPLWIIAEYWV